MIINSIYFKHHIEQVYNIPTEIITFYDLTIVIKGELKYKINDKTFTVRENSCILIPPHSKRQRIPTQNKTEYLSFNFFSDTAIDLPILMDKYIELGSMHLIFACCELAPQYDDRFKEFYNSILTTILNALELTHDQKKLNPITNKILSFIYENYYRQINVTSICNYTSYAKSYCNSVFKKDTGVSILKYLNNVRIIKAKEMLIESALSINEISMKLGFEDQNYFSRLFTKMTGISPSQYRKKFIR